MKSKSIKGLYYLMKGCKRNLLCAYKKASSDGAAAECTEQLTNDFYLIGTVLSGCLRELKSLKNEKRMVSSEDGKLPELFCILREFFLNRAELSVESIARLLKNYNPSFDEIGLTPLFISCATVFCISERCRRFESIAVEITQLRALSDFDFEQLYASCSQTEKALLNDEMYKICDDGTKNDIRFVFDRICTREQKTEKELLKEFENQAKQNSESLTAEILKRTEHSAEGRKLLAAEVLLPIFISAVLGFAFKSIILFVFGIFPIRALLGAFVFDKIYKSFGTRVLPKIKLRDGVPAPAGTVITVSSLLPDEEKISEVKNHLKELLLSCRGENVRVCLLADLKNSRHPFDAEDSVKILNSSRMIEELNREYPDSFMMFVRKRVYVGTQGEFSGRERKRGAIEDFAEYIVSDPEKRIDKKYLKICGATESLERYSYLLALDSDTSLNRDSLRELLSCALHPLNRAKISKLSGIVSAGYGIFVPSVSTKLESAYRTAFSRITAGTGGSSMYDLRCNEKYFDTFGSATFTGKGLIDLRAFHSVLFARFSEERILSHDILEGEMLRTAIVGSAEVSDDFPSNEISYFSRLHRWTRGDVQNLAFLKDKAPFSQGRLNPLSALSRYKLAENYFRAFSVISIFLSLPAALLCSERTGIFLILLSLSGYAAEELYALIKLIFSESVLSVGLRYFGDALPNAALLTVSLFYKLVLLVKTAFTLSDAVLRAFWRSLVSHKKMLEWTTAAQSESGKGSLIFNRYSLWNLLVSAAFIISPNNLLKGLGVFFLIGIFSSALSGRRKNPKKARPSPKEREMLTAEAYSMWRFYESCCTEENNYLPCDNIQLAPVYKQAHRTSPSNIGLMLAGTLCARDFSFIDTGELCRRVSAALSSIEKMEKYKGNLLNWYDTKTLEALSPRFVSVVDSGNFLCSLTALKAGLNQYRGESAEVEELIKRIDAITDECDLSFMYNSKRNLFHIGYYPEENRLSESYYDMLMSESRMTGYYALAKGQIPLKHWQMLSRTAAQNDVFFGPVSWGGTMFEYFMPHLFLPVHRNTLYSEALKFCLYSQKKAVLKKRIPFGISESGYYKFDANMNYCYKAHGVSALSLKGAAFDEPVISPYSTFLCLPFSAQSALKNLKRLREYDSRGMFGFYEALDFSEKRCAPKKYQSVKSYMAHHIGMSIISIDNYLCDNIMQKRFMSDDAMLSCASLLNERISRDMSFVIKEPLKRDEGKKEQKKENRLRTYAVKRNMPKTAVLSNGEWSTVISDNGAGFMCLGNETVSRYSPDLLTRPEGVLSFISVQGEALSLQAVTDREQKGKYYARFSKGSAYLCSKNGKIDSEIRISVDEGIPCERRLYRIKNGFERKRRLTLSVYFEPSFFAVGREDMHRAFSKLFVTARKNEEDGVVIIKKNPRGEGSKPVFCACGFTDKTPFRACLSREEALKRKSGVFSIGENRAPEKNIGKVDACVLLSVDFSLPPLSTFEKEFFITASDTEEGLLNNISEIRRREKKNRNSFLLKSDTVTSSFLSHILYNSEKSRQLGATVSREFLWKNGIACDRKLAVFTLKDFKAQRDSLIYWSGVIARLKSVGIVCELVIIVKSENREIVKKLLNAEFSTDALASSGIHIVAEESLSPDEKSYIYSKACFDLTCEELPTLFESGKKALKLVTSGKSGKRNSYSPNGFRISSAEQLPWCYAVSNRTFGTLVSDGSLGFSFCENSYLNKLTVWSNDTVYDNSECIYLKINGVLYDLPSLSEVTFGNERAVYKASVCGIECEIKLSVGEKAAKKTVECTLKNNGNEVEAEIYYYTEPLISSGLAESECISYEVEGNSLILRNAVSGDFDGYAVLSGQGGEMLVATVKSAFFSSGGESLSSCLNGCAAVGKRVRLKRNESITQIFSLCFARKKSAALYLAKNKFPERQNTRKIKVSTPNKSIDALVNEFLPNQIEDARLNMRAGFYQCSGAYGFRDQLQDVLALILEKPERVRQQIFRCAAVQFSEGDVLHWWHSIGSIRRGIRSRYSDDALWLVYVCAKYVNSTADTGILSKPVAFLEGEPLRDNETERYSDYRYSDVKKTLLEHLFLAFKHSVRLGEHSLILMRGGDWNDGMNLVGIRGKGESVWLSQFAVMVISEFRRMLEKIGRNEFSRELELLSEKLTDALNRYAFFDDRYIRAYTDSGKILGRTDSRHCSIDLLTQSFACLCGKLKKEDVMLGLRSAERELVDTRHGLIKLLSPAFDGTDSDIGYISAYPEGIRENAGQYTHSAIWFIKALVKSGQSDKAFRYLLMINPLKKFEDGDRHYKAEPYYLCGDVLSAEGCEGRGNWSIYTGAASWCYGTILEDFFGLRLEDGKLSVTPALPEQAGSVKLRIENNGKTQEYFFENKNGLKNKDNNKI